MSDALAQLVADFEQGFVVHDEVGLPNADYEGPRDMDRAPTGEPYVTVCSGCILEPNEAPAIWYTERNFAMSDWLMSAKGLAGESAGARNLYWREKPRWVEAEFVPVDQVAAMNDAALKRCMHIKVGFVYSRLLVSTMRPDGTEDSDAG